MMTKLTGLERTTAGLVSIGGPNQRFFVADSRADGVEANAFAGVDHG